MAQYDIKCRVVENKGCRTADGEYILGKLTPAGMCAKSYAAVATFANAMRFSEQTPYEKGTGKVVVTCPDGFVKYELTRVK